MSDQAIDAAVEKILGDQDYARRVYESPEETLRAEFDLAPGEWRSIAWCLREDVDGSLGDVRGQSSTGLDFSLVRYATLASLPALKPGIDRLGNEPTVSKR